MCMCVCLSVFLIICLSVYVSVSLCHSCFLCLSYGSVHLPFYTLLLLLLLLLGYVRWCSISITVAIPDGVYAAVFVLILSLLLIVPGCILCPLWFLVVILLDVSSGNIFSSSASLLYTVEVSDTYMCALAHLSHSLFLPPSLSHPTCSQTHYFLSPLVIL